MSDRLSEIKKRYDNHGYFNLSPIVSEEFGWLISEVERLRDNYQNTLKDLSYLAAKIRWLEGK
jgi:hypothetical protein